MTFEGFTLSRAQAARGAVSAPAVSDSALSPEKLVELLVLADRADLWASIAPGLGHDLANALMSLSFPGDHPKTREAAQARIERAHRVLNGMSEGPKALPLPIADLFDDVLAWHRMQLQLPFCEIRVSVEPELSGAGDARLHHAILAIVTTAKEAGAAAIELRARRAGEGAAIEIEADVAPAPGTASRRETVVRHLLAGLGGRFEVDADERRTTWRMLLPSTATSALAD